MIDLESIKKEYKELSEKLLNPELSSDWENDSKRYKQLEKAVNKQKEIEETKKQIEENQSIMSSGDDTELTALAETETPQLKESLEKQEKELTNLLKELESENQGESFNSVIVEIRAGAGGQEAALFAGDLYNMYLKYSQKQGWSQKVLDSSPTDLRGYKEIVFELKGKDSFKNMKQEGGVHRVQRIPETEKAGRIHTSTATVAVLPKPKPEDLKIKPDDLKIDYYRSSGPGGQNVNKRETAVRITHLKTGIVAASQTERNQLKNKENAMSILSAKLLEKREQEQSSKMSGQRNIQIGTADRSEKIRTYNFPQDRVTDHRIKKSWGNIQGIMQGDIEKLIKDLNNNLSKTAE